MDARTKALVNATVFTGEEVHEDCSVVIKDGLIADVVRNGRRVRGAGTVINVRGHRLVPGFIDLQVNGGGGVLFNNSPTVDTLRMMSATHARFGTTSFLPALISDYDTIMRAAIEAVRQANDEGVPGVLGIHLEGPYLSPKRRGAHQKAQLRNLDERGQEILTSAGHGLVTLVTLAPERVSPDTIERLCEAGVVVFAGHSQATFEQCREALDAGMSGFTHLFNGMENLSARNPGVIGAALDATDSVFTIIADGRHVHPSLLRTALDARAPGAAILITDAMATVGSEARSFSLYGQEVELKDGELRDADGSLAGSNLSMIEAVRNIMRMAELHWTEAVRMASSYPARAIGLDHQRGFIKPGYAADMVELDADMVVHGTWVGGRPGKLH